jgi:hypothetical protein
VRQTHLTLPNPPDLISKEEPRQYCLYVKNVKKYWRASTLAICGIKFFYEKTLSVN